jgi:two-component system response regulator EvgA
MRASQIATEFHVSAKTIGTYKRRILDKLGLESTADLVRFAIHHHLRLRPRA